MKTMLVHAVSALDALVPIKDLTTGLAAPYICLEIAAAESDAEVETMQFMFSAPHLAQILPSLQATLALALSTPSAKH